MNGIVYLHISPAYTSFLVVSLLSLRKHDNSPVCILTDDTGEQTARRIAADSRLGSIRVKPDIKVPAHENFDISANQAKADVPMLSPFDKSIYLDSDTIVVGDISALWTTENEVVLTKRAMAALSTNVKRRRDCIEWKDVEPGRATFASRRSFQQRYPVINAGVYGFSRQTMPFHEHARRLTHTKPIRGADEIAMQLVYPEYAHRLLGREYNGNVCFDQDKEVVIWHGGRRWFLNKPQGRAILYPVLEEAIALNLGGLADVRSDPAVLFPDCYR